MTARVPRFTVLILIDGLWVGGTERSIAELLPRLRTVGIECRVAVLRRCREGVEDEVRAHGFSIQVLEGPRLLTQVRALRRLLAETQPDLLHTALYRSNVVGRLAVAGTRVPLLCSLVNTPYDPARQTDPSRLQRRLRAVQAVDSLTARVFVDRFHAVSEAAKAAAVRDLGVPAARITVVRRGRDELRLGAPSAERRAAMRSNLGLRLADAVLVSVGRQDHQKGQRFLIGALARLLPHHPDVRLLVVGREGGETVALQNAARSLGLSERVHFLGHREDVPDILAAADVFAFPSLFEGYPGAVLEAMALGLPIVASAIPPTREILEDGDTGLLVPPSDEVALTRALDRVLRSAELRRRLGDRARLGFLARHTLGRSVLETTQLYEDVLTAHSIRSATLATSRTGDNGSGEEAMSRSNMARVSMPWALLSKVQPLQWFLRKPSLHVETVRPTHRRLAVQPARDHTQTRGRTEDWCRARAVDGRTALVTLGASAGEPSLSVRALFPEQFAAAERAASAALDRMGAPGDLDLLYHAAEFLGARRVIEIGAAHGWSSLALLLSIAQREGSLLVSTDLSHFKPEIESYVGAVVPADLRRHWNLDSCADRGALPRAIKLLGAVDLCLYHGDKSPSGQALAYPMLWEALRPGGLFIFGAIDDNDYFQEFTERVGVEPTIVEGQAGVSRMYFGILRKPLVPSPDGIADDDSSQGVQ